MGAVRGGAVVSMAWSVFRTPQMMLDLAREGGL